MKAHAYRSSLAQCGPFTRWMTQCGRVVRFEGLAKLADGETLTRAIDDPSITCRSCRRYRDCGGCHARVVLPKRLCGWCRAARKNARRR